jgi:hypothetical protein
MQKTRFGIIAAVTFALACVRWICATVSFVSGPPRKRVIRCDSENELSHAEILSTLMRQELRYDANL